MNHTQQAALERIRELMRVSDAVDDAQYVPWNAPADALAHYHEASRPAELSEKQAIAEYTSKYGTRSFRCGHFDIPEEVRALIRANGGGALNPEWDPSPYLCPVCRLAHSRYVPEDDEIGTHLMPSDIAGA